MRVKLLARRGFHSNSSIRHSISGIKSVFCRKEAGNFVPSSNASWRGRSYAVSVASDLPDPEKYGKRVPVEDRRAMVKSFVDKYKASNAGKLPSLSHTWKQVGGSFYVVRKIFQELQYESTMSSLNSRSKNSFRKTATKENPNIAAKHLAAAPDRRKSSCAAKILSADDDVERADLVSHSVLPLRSHLLEEVISVSHKKADGDDKELGISEHVHTESESHVLENERDVVSDLNLESKSSCEELKHEGSKNSKEQQVHTSLELDREENINNRKVNNVAEVPTSESKPWGQRIKSIVDGIFNMWRKP